MENAEQRQIALLEAESNMRQHYEDRQHWERMAVLNEASNWNKFVLLKPKLFKDGNQWCVLLGDNIQEGICGFGDTPNKALFDWNAQFDKN